MPISDDDLATALVAAATAHHNYEQNALRGTRDEHWAGWYAAYVLGRLGDFTTPTKLAGWLAQAEGDDWTTAAAVHVASQISL